LFYFLQNATLEGLSRLGQQLNIGCVLTGVANDGTATRTGQIQILMGNPGPRAYVVNRWRLPPPNFVIPNLLGHPEWFRETAFVDAAANTQGDAVAIPEFDLNAPTTGPTNAVVLLEDGRNRVRIVAKVDHRSLLIVNDTWAPGWEASVDGHWQPLFRANVWFRGVFLEKGEHEISLKYRPRLFTAGLAMAALGLGLTVLCLARGTWRSRVKKSSKL
jgi:hypothetical protein